MKWNEKKWNEMNSNNNSAAVSANSELNGWMEKIPNEQIFFNEASAAAADTWNMLFSSRSKKGKIHFSIFISMENEYEN